MWCLSGCMLISRKLKLWPLLRINGFTWPCRDIFPELCFSSLVRNPGFLLYTVSQVVVLCSQEYSDTTLKLWDINLENMLERDLLQLLDLVFCRVSGLETLQCFSNSSAMQLDLNIVSCDWLGKTVLVEHVPSLQQVTFSRC